MPSANRSKPNDTLQAVNYALRIGQYKTAATILGNAITKIRQARDWRVFKELCETPKVNSDAVLIQDSTWRILIARVLHACGDEVQLEAWLNSCSTIAPLEPELKVLEAFVLICRGQYQEVQNALQPLFPLLTGYWAGLARQRLLWAAHRLHQPWQDHLTAIRQHHTGRNLGLALTDACMCLYSEQRNEQALTLGDEALTHFKTDAHHTAWLNLELGYNLLTLCDARATKYFEQAHEATLHQNARALRHKTLAALAALRRTRGEWRMAFEFYRRAIEAALESNETLEIQQYQLNLARTHRLAGNPQKALEMLQETLEQSPKNPSDFWLEVAAAHLQLGDSRACGEALTKVTRVYGGDVQLKRLLETELARQEGDVARVLELWQGLNVQTRVTREEMPTMPNLQAWALERGLSVPETLPRFTQTVVRVHTKPKIAIFINGRELQDLNATQDIRFLLHLLHFQGRAIDSEELGLAVFEREETINDKKTILHDLIVKVAKRLRHRLEYPESICDDGKTYWLDPETIWQLDTK
jgi:tetratricopeptide (TPR) repeat protein